MSDQMAEKIGVVNQGTVHNQTNNVTIVEGEKTRLLYSDPLPDRTHFQGRTTELGQLSQWLQDPQTAMIGIRGEGGIGKSTLAAQAFADCLGFARKCWLDVRAGTTITKVAQSALQEFGVPPQQVKAIEEKDLPQRLLRQLQIERCLLAIDNLESVLSQDGVWQSGYEEFVDQFQSLGSESVLLLAGREYPPKYFGWRRSRWLSVDTGLEPVEGAALLAALEAEGTEAERIVLSTQVQGNPLALSLLAGWLREEYRPGNRSVQHLNQQPDLFQVEGKHRGEKQISVERVFDWSFHRLTSDLQQLLTQVSVLRGAFNQEAVAALVQQPVGDRELRDLERRSLLQELSEVDKYGLNQYRLQPRIQDFAQKRGGDLTEAHILAIIYFLRHRQTEFAPDDTQAAASEYLETYYHLCQLGQYQLAAQIVFDCNEFLDRRGYFQLLVELYQHLHASWQPTPEQREDYAVICNNLGNAYRSLGEYQRSIDLHQQHYEISREIDNQQGAAASLNNLGNAYRLLGEYQRAIDFLDPSLKIAREIGDRQGEANALGNLGLAYRALGEYQRAIDFQQQCLELKREIGDRQGEANALGSLGNAYQALGQYERAIDFQQQHYKISCEIGDRQGKAASLGNLGAAYRALGQYQQTIDFLELSLRISCEIGDRRAEAASLGNLSLAYRALGEYQRAIDFHQQHYEISCEIGSQQGKSDSLFNKALALAKLDNYWAARDGFQQARKIYANLQLAHMIEKCDKAIREQNQIIAVLTLD
jgi:tetratricopeptide (TPR) repeat protein